MLGSEWQHKSKPHGRWHALLPSITAFRELEVVRGGVKDEDLYNDDIARRDVAKPILSSARSNCDAHSQGGPSMEKEDALQDE
jgi:hypothetical protein